MTGTGSSLQGRPRRGRQRPGGVHVAVTGCEPTSASGLAPLNVSGVGSLLPFETAADHTRLMSPTSAATAAALTLPGHEQRFLMSYDDSPHRAKFPWCLLSTNCVWCRMDAADYKTDAMNGLLPAVIALVL